MLLFKLIRESYLFAIQAIVANKLRTFLTLLGITIGIFSIISVLTVVDSLKSKINESIASLGSNVVYVQKWPWEFGSDYPWWKYLSRPVVKLDELEQILNRSQLTEYASYSMNTNKTIQAGRLTLDNISIVGISNDYDKTTSYTIGEGRYFTPNELRSGLNKAIVGVSIVEQLFPNTNPINQSIKIWGAKVEIIGVFKKEGMSMMGPGLDRQVVLPAKFASNYEELTSDNVNPSLAIRPRPGVSNAELKSELRGILRSVRKIKPSSEDNFALNESDMITKGFEPIFSALSIAGWFIGIFSLLVGGFGIANIMFVSVVERTSQIGIQKAIGAKRYFILLQFLFEAVFLSLIGGAIGLFLIFLITLAVSAALDFSLTLTSGNIILGLTVSFVIGVLAGIIPAISASKLDPVEAIRQGS
jgi:putative ABC transport system permease protein